MEHRYNKINPNLMTQNIKYKVSKPKKWFDTFFECSIIGDPKVTISVHGSSTKDVTQKSKAIIKALKTQ